MQIKKRLLRTIPFIPTTTCTQLEQTMDQHALTLRIHAGSFTCEFVRVPKSSTVTTALRVAGHPGPFNIARSSVVLNDECDAVGVLDGVPLDIQINAAANANSINLATLSRPPLLIVTMDITLDDMKVIPNSNFVFNGMPGVGAPRQRRRSRVITENAIAASVAFDAANPDNDGELPTVEVSLPPARGHSANTPAPRKVARTTTTTTAMINRHPQLNISETQPSITFYVVLTLTPPRKMNSLVFTLFCGLAGELQSQRASFITPKAEPLLRELFADAATYLLYVQHVGVVSLRNIAIGNVGGIGLFSDHNVLVKAATALRQSPLLPGMEVTVDAGNHWNDCNLRNDLKLLANEAAKYTVEMETTVAKSENIICDGLSREKMVL